MEEVFKLCYCCFDASFFTKGCLPRRAINSLATPEGMPCGKSHKDTKILFIVMLVIGHFTYLGGGIE